MKKIYALLTYLLISGHLLTLHAQTITTVAGTGVQGYNGDNQAATIAYLDRAAGVTTDASGNIYIADWQNNRIRKINSAGFITTIVGTGTAGYNGENIAGNMALLRLPTALAFDQSGNLYIADANNNRIRKVSTNNTVTTYAGTGISGYNGDNVLAINAQISYPTNGIVADASGNIYFSDTYNNRVRKISTSGIITTIAGTGTAGFNGDGMDATLAQLNYPYGLVFDQSGNLIVVDCLNQRIRKISPSGIITTIAGSGVVGFSGDNGPALAAQVHNPCGLAIDAQGNLFFSDVENSRIRKISYTGTISTIAGTGATSYNGDNIPASLANLNFPNGIAIDNSGNLLIAEAGNSRIRKISNAAVILPLSLTKFTASLQNGVGVLQWQTNNEVNTQKFEVEHSQDGAMYTTLNSVNAKNVAGNNNYSFIDAAIKSGVTYYRLKIVDKDGRFTYSNVINLRVNEVGSIRLSPNPVKDATNLSFTAFKAGKYTIQIVDMAGKTVHQVYTNAVTGSNKVTFDTHSYSSGEYLLIITNATGLKANVKFTK